MNLSVQVIKLTRSSINDAPELGDYFLSYFFIISSISPYDLPQIMGIVTHPLQHSRNGLLVTIAINSSQVQVARSSGPLSFQLVYGERDISASKSQNMFCCAWRKYLE